MPEPEGKGVSKTTQSGPFETPEVTIDDNTTSVVCRAISVRDEDGKQSGMAG